MRERTDELKTKNFLINLAVCLLRRNEFIWKEKKSEKLDVELISIGTVKKMEDHFRSAKEGSLGGMMGRMREGNQ